MVQKPIVRTWHREEFALGNKENIPPAALAILESEKRECKQKKAATEATGSAETKKEADK